MALSVFEDRAHPPTASEVARALGAAAPAWREVVARVSGGHAPIEERWAFAGAKFGWSLRLVRRERVVLYLTPQSRQVLVGIVLGEKAVERALAGALPAAVKQAIDDAPRYAEGRGVRIVLTRRSQVPALAALVAAKLAV